MIRGVLQLHERVVLALEQLADVRARGRAGQEALQRNLPVLHRVEHGVHDAHAPARELLPDLVPTRDQCVIAHSHLCAGDLTRIHIRDLRYLPGIRAVGGCRTWGANVVLPADAWRAIRI
jgi:hypothetical protein